MLRHIEHTKMGRGSHGWLESYFHFSFAEYNNPDNLHFGLLRVLNDDLVQPGAGFPPHPHRDMEIISYVVSGELSHEDSMGNTSTLGRGQAQYMSAGTGVVHSEFNRGTQVLRLVQVWIFPDKKGHTPHYGDHPFRWEDRIDQWLPIASGYGKEASQAPIRVHADVHVFSAVISAGKSLELKLGAARQAYLVLLEGDARVEAIQMTARDALEIVQEDVVISTEGGAHVYVVEMPASTHVRATRTNPHG